MAKHKTIDQTPTIIIPSAAMPKDDKKPEEEGKGEEEEQPPVEGQQSPTKASDMSQSSGKSIDRLKNHAAALEKRKKRAAKKASKQLDSMTTQEIRAMLEQQMAEKNFEAIEGNPESDDSNEDGDKDADDDKEDNDNEDELESNEKPAAVDKNNNDEGEDDEEDDDDVDDEAEGKQQQSEKRKRTKQTVPAGRTKKVNYSSTDSETYSRQDPPQLFNRTYDTLIHKAVRFLPCDNVGQGRPDAIQKLLATLSSPIVFPAPQN